jgi:ZIP family zinc transporter
MGQAGQELTALSLALAGGAMIYMTFCEVLPRALQGGRRSAAAVGVAGVLFGLITVQLLA